jgi:hypothetical protein
MLQNGELGKETRMSLSTKPAPASQRRIWKAPTSKAKWYWLIASVILYALIVVWYIYALKTQQFPGPIEDPLRLFGIISLVLVLITASYTLRRRFMRNLPGMVQNWLWLHTWLGICALLIAMLHENFAFITHDFFPNGLSSLTDTYLGAGALYALIFLVLSGIVGRLLDIWQTRIIAREASSNGVGIVRALEEKMLELEYTVERLSAGKSEAFKQYCLQAIERGGERVRPPSLPPVELADFERAQATIQRLAQLRRSRQRQLNAQRVITSWRTIHIILACIALCVILYHGVMELLTNVFNFIRPS